MGQIGIGPDGRITTDTQRAQGNYSQATCERDRQNLAQLDNWQTFMDLLDRANRSNVSFYPIDSRGLPASDAPIEADVPPAVGSAAAHRADRNISAHSPRRPTAWRS